VKRVAEETKNEKRKTKNAKWLAIPVLRFSFLVFHFSLPFFCAAQDSVTLPLQGYYHPGRYMPIHVVATGQSKDQTVRIDAPGSLWTWVKTEGGHIDAIVPWLAIDDRPRAAGALQWSFLPRIGSSPIQPPLKPLSEQQRLIGFAGPSSAAALKIAAGIYPGDELIPIALNPAEPLGGPPAAWEALDLVVLDAAAAVRIGEARFAPLVGSGVAFAVQSNGSAAAPPWPHWPWQQQEGGWWIMRFAPAGPKVASYEAAAYEPIANWRSGWPWSIRRQILLMAAALVIPMLLLALWRPRGTAIWALLLSGASLCGMGAWGNWRKPNLTIVANVKVIGADITQDDQWYYQISHLRTTSLLRWADVTKPIFSSPARLDECDARLMCYPNGDPDFIFFNLLAGHKLAVLWRRCGPQGPIATPSDRVTTPMLGMVRELYLGPGDRVLGELSTPAVIGEAYLQSTQWAGVVVKRGAGVRQN
jgi:hypothetical protein